MLQTTTITQKWQMTLPKKIRQALGIKTPGKILVEIVDKKEKFLRISKSPSILELYSSLPAKNRKNESLNIDRLRDYIEKNYQRK